MTKKNKTPFGIFIKALELYFSNFIQFFKYMSFPVLGQVLGLAVIFIPTLFYSKKLPELVEHYKIFNDFTMLVLISVLVALPGMIIILKAFWEYLVAYGAINSMLDNMLKSGKVYDFKAHTELIKRRTPSFVILWLILGLFGLIASFPLFWIPAGVIGIYIVLVFQVFTYEPDLSPVGCIKKSVNLIKGHFPSTFLVIGLSGLIFWVLVPQIFNCLFENIGLSKIFSNAVLPLIESLPLTDLNSLLLQYGIPELKNEDMALLGVSSIISQILIQYTLPFRSLLCGLWYKELNDSTPESNPVKKKSSKKRPSEKLMEETHKRYSGTKRLDKNILKRAMEKDDEE